MNKIKIRYVYEVASRYDENDPDYESQLKTRLLSLHYLETRTLRNSIENEEGHLLKILARNLFSTIFDRKGIEIYEGDICKYSEKGVNQIIASIEYETSCFLFDKVPLHSWLDKDGKCILEVIGNIYENPELMEVTKR